MASSLLPVGYGTAGDEARSFTDALLSGDRRRALAASRAALDRGVDHLYECVVVPAMHRIGELWSQNLISVADEHMATCLAQTAVASLYPLFPWPCGGPRALIACPEGERHEFGARLVADLLALDGWDARFLGADVPLDDLIKAELEFEPVLFGVSVTLVSNLSSTAELLQGLRASGRRPKVLVGGRAVSARCDGGPELDAVHASSARQAVALARGWKSHA